MYNLFMAVDKKYEPERMHPKAETVGIGLEAQDVIDLKTILRESGTENPKLLALVEHMPETDAVFMWENSTGRGGDTESDGESILPLEKTVSGLNDLVMVVAVIRKGVVPGAEKRNSLPMKEFVQAVRKLSGREVSEEEIIWWRSGARDELRLNGSQAGMIIDPTPSRGVGAQILVIEDISNAGELLLAEEQRKEYRENLEMAMAMGDGEFRQQLNYSIDRQNKRRRPTG